LPSIKDVVWLAPEDWQSSKGEARADMFSFKQAGLSFLDLLASCDVLITKVGYGSFVEATAHAVPVLYIDRPDWPETPYLTTWLCENGNAALIEECDLFSPRLESQLREIWEQPSKPAIHADGAEQAARRLLAHQKPVQATGLK
jgi:UDP-N-acetylglucosamine:LPS N-acetylglucosamine transferase